MKIDASLLNQICPMHVLLDATGHVRQFGPTLQKLQTGSLRDARFLEVFEVYRPRGIDSMARLLASHGHKLHLRLRNDQRTQLKAMVVPDGEGGALVNLGFGISVMEAVRDYALTGSDFAATDLAMELLFLVEAKSAAMNASTHLNTRLVGQKNEAEERAFTDGLTGLRNRRSLDAVLGRFCRGGPGFALMHVDLDFFKQVNDTYGHAAGDLVLCEVAEKMLAETRKEDTVARVGGDEFVLVIADLTDRTQLANIASRLIEEIEKPVIHEGQSCHVSASIGIALSHGEPTDPAALMERADMALYASKRAGRAQFHFFDTALANPNQGDQTAIAGE